MLVFTDNKEAVRPFFQKHGVEAEILQEPDLTLCATYARIGEVASGDYVLPLEDDDVFKPEKTPRLMDSTVTRPKVSGHTLGNLRQP